MPFSSETKFEEALIDSLSKNGWESKVLEYYTEQQLIDNWANILFTNNRDIDKLNDYPLTEGEMQQILEQIKNLKTPLKLNGFINGKNITITRDNPADVMHFGKEVSLKIYDRKEIAAGQSRYQIARQPKFSAKSKLLNQRRGDLTLLINGMPVIHIELKKSDIPVSQAYHQIEKYSKEGIFTGLFSLVQIFVAMTPEETLYFANPGPDGVFNPNFYFHWANFDNEPINDWKQISSTLLSIPMAHQLIGFYTIADSSDGILKVMRSYQYNAANAISDKVAKTKWDEKNQLGGYIWHTTGSGKTMTSFKSAQLIASSKDADKVIFLMDRIELGTQSLNEYRAFAEESEEVQATENTGALVAKLKSNDPANTLIVTSIQKMSNIKDEADGGLKAEDIKLMNSKRIVFIVDECHRSTFGDMLITIKQTFPHAIFFGFTGTPIQDENQKKHNTTSSVFGNELHRYSIADGIRDKNVLGFDPYKVLTYKDNDLKRAVALEKAKATTLEEALANPQKSKIFYEYVNLPMAGWTDKSGDYKKGIEDFISMDQYDRDEHREMVIDDIIENWDTLSHASKFHAILATSSIPEAIAYYRLMKEKAPKLKVTALFDPNIDNNGKGMKKEEGLLEIITDYNDMYDQSYTIPTFQKMKKDMAARLSHKEPYTRINFTPEKRIDILIVVDQMLTGFDSKWINTLYLDKMLQYENIIQAFSRTNRIFTEDKPFGVIKYYRKPHTMERNIADAIKLYSGDKPFGLFVDKLDRNLENMNFSYKKIKDLFEDADIEDFMKLPEDTASKKMFAKLFKEFNEYLEAAKIQGFTWKQSSYQIQKEDDTVKSIQVLITEKTYLILAQRYKELSSPKDSSGSNNDDIPYDIDGYLTTIATDDIDTEYMNSRFEKYLKLLQQPETDLQLLKQAEEELHRTFASLSQEDQKIANIFLHDIERGDVVIKDDMSFRDYLTEYKVNTKDTQIHNFAITFGLDENKLKKIMNRNVTENNINAYGDYQELLKSVNKQKAQKYFTELYGMNIILPKVNAKMDLLLRSFILSKGFELAKPEKE